jgi:hypothetical protein
MMITISVQNLVIAVLKLAPGMYLPYPEASVPRLV